MPPSTNKKASQAKSSAARNDRRSTSRHSTPLTDTSAPTPLTNTPSTTSAPISAMAKETPYLHIATADLISSESSIENLIESSGSGGGAAGKHGDPPSARDLHILHNKIRDVVNRTMAKRSEVCNHSMRLLVQIRKEYQLAQQEEAAARAEQERMKAKRDAEEEKRRKEEKKALSKKRSHEEMENGDAEDKANLPDVGAHGLARQDGVGLNEGAPAPPSPPVPQGAIVDDPMDVAPSPADSTTSSRDDQPSTAPLYERIYGTDPTQVEDPIVYDIRDLTDDMAKDDKQQILNVAQWPESDLHDLTAGDPPDMDFSNAKPANQINFSTFQTYVDPYIRAFTEEDVAYLKERGDRFTPYIIPPRGTKGYKEVWATEDGTTGIEPPQKHVNNPNEARGSMEDLEDDIADQDTVSMGPSMSRMLALFRQQPTAPKKEPADDDANNGDISMLNGDADPTADPDDPTTTTTNPIPTLKPVTHLPNDTPKPTTLPQLDYETFEQRALAEFRHIGIIGAADAPDYDAQLDDEVSARLRTLQAELARVARRNNARKARVLELTEERMAMQEYANIADDLDTQVNAAYLKRNRSLAKPGQKKGAAAAHAAQLARKGVAVGVAGGGRGVSDGVRALMQKRRDWIDMVGPVVGYGRAEIPEDGQTIFDDANMRRLEKAEREAELGDAEGE